MSKDNVVQFPKGGMSREERLRRPMHGLGPFSAVADTLWVCCAPDEAIRRWKAFGGPQGIQMSFPGQDKRGDSFDEIIIDDIYCLAGPEKRGMIDKWVKGLRSRLNTGGKWRELHEVA